MLNNTIYQSNITTINDCSKGEVKSQLAVCEHTAHYSVHRIYTPVGCTTPVEEYVISFPTKEEAIRYAELGNKK